MFGQGRPGTGDFSAVGALSGQVVSILSAMNGVKDIERDDKPGKEQITVDLDYIRLAENELRRLDQPSGQSK